MSIQTTDVEKDAKTSATTPKDFVHEDQDQMVELLSDILVEIRVMKEILLTIH